MQKSCRNKVRIDLWCHFMFTKAPCALHLGLFLHDSMQLLTPSQCACVCVCLCAVLSVLLTVYSKPH